MKDRMTTKTTPLPFPAEPKALFGEGLDPLMRFFDEPDPAENPDPRIWGQVQRDEEAVKRRYQSVARSRSYGHDEPWLTLMALYGLFSDQADLTQGRLDAWNRLMRGAFPSAPPAFETLFGAFVEVCLHENKFYQAHLRERVFKEGKTPYHLFKDRSDTIAKKCAGNGSLEGNTNLDALISGTVSGHDRQAHVFIEAKFHSDISYAIRYSPVRNQIARNVDCALDLMTRPGSDPNPAERDLDALQDFWFVLLTPGMFRTEAFGGPEPTALSDLNPSGNRLYGYKMDEYLDPEKLRRDLPHWDRYLGRSHWETLSRRIGWLTFEDVNRAVLGAGLLPQDQVSLYSEFMTHRGVLPS